MRSAIAGSLAVTVPGMAATIDPPNEAVRYAPAASWILPPPAPTDSATPADAALRVVYADTQTRIGATGVDTYNASRIRILKPEALQLGNLTLSWTPYAGSLTANMVHIIRAGAVIDVLKSNTFQVVQREGALEQAMLTGDRTAVLQIPGLQVGDEIEIGTTTHSRDPAFGEHAFAVQQMPPQGIPGSFRFRLAWPDKQGLIVKASPDLDAARVKSDDDRYARTYELRDPRGVVFTDGAPSRFNVRRLVEYSDFSGWPEVSRLFSALMERAATLGPSSPLRAEARRIAAASSDRRTQAEAALRLVQDQIRYVYVGLDGGNYRPAAVDETWSRRFGDCKAKTAVLLALLHELGIDAEAVLVNPAGDDGIDTRLPSPGPFNHVLVRARIGGQSYWLDGTRLGDRSLAQLPPPRFHWVLPVRSTGAELERATPLPFTRPQFIGVLNLDARAGFDKPAKIALQHLYRGDDAYTLKTALTAVSGDDANRQLREYWKRAEGWVDADTVGWRFDEATRTIVLTLAGTATTDWSGDDEDGHMLVLWGAGFTPPDRLVRPADQDRSAPWLNEFPRYKCWAGTFNLPPAGRKWRWSYEALPMNRRIGGVRYWRTASMNGSTVRVVMSRSVDREELTAAEAKAQTDAIAGFNNNKSTVSEVPRNTADQLSYAAPFADDADWTNDDSACAAPAQ